MANLSASDRRRLAAELRHAQNHGGLYVYGDTGDRLRIILHYEAEAAAVAKAVLRRWLTAARARAIVDAALRPRRTR